MERIPIPLLLIVAFVLAFSAGWAGWNHFGGDANIAAPALDTPHYSMPKHATHPPKSVRESARSNAREQMRDSMRRASPNAFPCRTPEGESIGGIIPEWRLTSDAAKTAACVKWLGTGSSAG